MSEQPENNRDPFKLSGTTIEGKYRVLSVIGDGGFGVVYRGEHIGFGESIAIKCLKLPAELNEKGRAQFLEQLREEGRLLHRLSRVTSGIVQALDVGAFVAPNGVWVPYLVLEWLEGETLGELIKGRTTSTQPGMSAAEAIALLEPAARALAVAHAQKIAHRDVKPANIFVTDVGGKRTVKVLDFGIAKVLTEHASFTEALAATRQGPTAFTPRYGAPEQFNKQRGATGPWTDVFALALIFVELVSGRKALEGDDPTELYIIAADPSLRPTPKSRGADVPEAVERVIEKALSVEPKHRFTDAGAFWDALVAALGQDVVSKTGGSAAKAAAAVTPQAGSRMDPADSMLSTAEFAEKKQLDVSSDGAPGNTENPALSMTEPATTLAKPGATMPAAKLNTATRDPMAETPLGERLPQPAIVKPEPPKEPAQHAAAKDPAEKTAGVDTTSGGKEADKPGRPVWPWLLLVLLGAGGALGYTLFTMGSPKDKHPPKTSPSALATTSSKTTTEPPRANASAAASASAAPSASAAAPFVPPRDMVLVPPGKARIGEGPDAREVTLSHGVYLDAMEVTTAQYRQCTTCPSAKAVVLPPESLPVIMSMADAGPDDEGPPDPAQFIEAWTPKCNDVRGAGDHPINCVSFAAAEAYCTFRNKRLPTEAEWELAARGAAGRNYPWGDDAPGCNRACFDRNGKCLDATDGISTCLAGGRPLDRTPEGLFDLGGNVAEWVADGYASPPPAGLDPKGPPSVPLRVVRGGSFLDAASHTRATHRTGVAPKTAHVTIGFRCALDAPPPDPAAPPKP